MKPKKTLKEMVCKVLTEEYELDADQIKILDLFRDELVDFYSTKNVKEWKVADTDAYKSLVIDGGSSKLVDLVNKFRDKGGWVVATVQAKGSDKVFGAIEPPDDPIQFTLVPNGSDVIVSCWVVRGGRQSLKPLINKVVPDTL